MRYSVEFKHFDPPPALTALIDRAVAGLERHAPDMGPDAFLRLFIAQNDARTLYHVSLRLTVPGRTLATQEERHDPEEAVHAAFAEIERQLLKWKEHVRDSWEYKRPARREELRRLKG
jgi:ribosome-associated translation inhibitor RaiA